MLNKFPSLKKNIFNLFRKGGIEVKRYNLHNSERALVSHIVKHYGIDMLIDIGANVGDYVSDLYQDGYQGAAISFEPIQQVYDVLTKNAARYSKWKTLKNGVGSRNEMTEINVSENLVSSSLLQVTQKSIEAEPSTHFIRSEKINVVTFDHIYASENLESCQRIFVKIDVQGYELEVLKGASQHLADVFFLQVELSLVDLYHGAPNYLDLIAIMGRQDFEVFTIIPGFRDSNTGRMMQADGIFINRKLAEALRR